MFRTLLIANRGEIACRIARTAQRLGIRTIAVYSDADAGALHTRVADQAVRIGPATASQSYLSIEAILAAARATGADAIHPGYGFLSQSAEFAERCAAAGVTFVGPPASATRLMGVKDQAKALMQRAGVPVVPGYFGDRQDEPHLLAEAERIGFPLLIKAVAGGGGRGMRVVRSASDFRAALSAAQGEAGRSFGDGRVLLERYIERGRHVEVQVLADRHGRCLHLLERDCSLQRRYQKIIEEAPAPLLSTDVRSRLYSAAVAAAKAVKYENAGTVEFIVDGDDVFFLEMNTRLQVEHPVTEMILGLDLVELQLRIAAGEPLQLEQSAIAAHGHAFEARIYAEDARRNFLPSGGRIRELVWPAEEAIVRVDAALEQGDRIITDYDALLAKLIVWGADRDQALQRLRAALGATRIEGVATNLPALLALADDPEVEGGRVYTRLIDERGDKLLEAADVLRGRAAVLGAVTLLATSADRAPAPTSPWSLTDGWTLHGHAPALVRLANGTNSRFDVTGTRAGDEWHFAIGSQQFLLRGVSVAPAGGDSVLECTADVNGVAVRWSARIEADRLSVWLRGEWHRFDRLASAADAQARPAGGEVLAPMPGVVLSVSVSSGEAVTRGRTLLVMEAMKMEHTLTASAAGVVGEVRVKSGDRVREGDRLLTISSPPE